MEAFPKDSMNMALGGAGPLRSRLDLDKFHGRGAEGFSEFAATRKPDTVATMPVVVNPHDRAEQVHGDESFGLGTSTFLEGAPASRRAVAQRRRESEEDAAVVLQDGGVGGGGLSRKKSLAQRLRGMSNTRRQISGDARSPGSQIPPSVTRWNGNINNNNPSSGADAGMSGETVSPPRPQQQIKAVSAGGPARARAKADEVNPFFDVEYDAAFERKGAQIAEASTVAPALTRSVTNDGTISPTLRDGEAGKGVGGGLLSRMRSLKGGGRRARPERREGVQ